MIKHGDAEKVYRRALRDDSDPRDDLAQNDARCKAMPDNELDPSPGTPTHFAPDQCENTACSLPRGHFGQHSSYLTPLLIFIVDM